LSYIFIEQNYAFIDPVLSKNGSNRSKCFKILVKILNNLTKKHVKIFKKCYNLLKTRIVEHGKINTIIRQWTLHAFLILESTLAEC
jgi:hypothetical protein